jgi:hypothetical protein
MRRQFFIAGLILLGACSQFESNRSYLSEMERDDSTMYTPNEDFPVMNGDTGTVGWGLNDYRRRTPASADDLRERRTTMSLKQELRALEGQQSEEQSELYEEHKHQLATTSERIYYLKLHPRERRDYLASRGFLKDSPLHYQDYQERSPASGFGLRNNTLGIGMSKSDVINTWGRPTRVEVAGNPSYENERWAYKKNGATKYIYFESGSVQGWE